MQPTALGLDLRHMFLSEETSPLTTRMSSGDLVEELRRKVAAAGRSVEEIGSQIGWDIDPLMRDPQQLWEFNVDGLRGLCAFAEVDWTALLAEIPN